MRTNEELLKEVQEAILDDDEMTVQLISLEVQMDIRDLLQRSENRIGQFVADFPDLRPPTKIGTE